MPAALALLLLTLGPAAHGDLTVAPPWPGLPKTVFPASYKGGFTVGSEGNGLTEAVRARQWIKVPAQAVAAVVGNTAIALPDDPDRSRFGFVLGHAYLSSPAGASVGYGISLPITVRTVAFGAIPAQATIQLEQLRDADGLPVPLVARWTSTQYRQTRVVNGVSVSELLGVDLTGQVRARITTLTVDGVDLGLRDCVSPVIDLNLHGNPYWSDDPLHDPQQHDPVDDEGKPKPAVEPMFPIKSKKAAEWMASLGQSSNITGGAVTGEVDIPAFSRCVTRSGEDVSPLVTATVSGPGNPLTVGMAAFERSFGCGTALGPPPLPKIARAPFRGDPSDCDPDFAPPTLDLPARPTGD